MKGKDPRDAGFITSRICGICGDNHTTCSDYAQQMAYGVKPPPLAEHIVNLGEAAEYMFDHTIFQDNLVWVTALASILLAFTSWDGIGFDSIKWVGLDNFHQLFSDNPQFWPAVEHNVIWFVVLILIPTPFGLFLAVQLDKKIRFSRVYQTAFFLPVVISLACIGFVWQLIYNPDTGLINSLIGANKPGHYIDWIGDPNLNLWAVLVAASWRHTGYMMILYLAGLKSVDPSLREASALDGANEWQTFKNVIFPTLRPTNTIVLVVTIIEALRAFDLVFVFNKGAQGTELLSILVTNNIIGESSRIGEDVVDRVGGLLGGAVEEGLQDQHA
ncbi:ABC transporter permease subunit, partial [Streptomyces sp. NPDC005921]